MKIGIWLGLVAALAIAPAAACRCRRPRAARRIESTAVIDRDEVLHVARLARLALSEEEIEPMARELSAVLDHVAKIGELTSTTSRRRRTWSR